MIEWVWPYAFALLPLPVLARRLWRASEQRQAALTVPNLGAFQLHADAATERPGKHFPWRLLLLWTVWLILVAAAARPPMDSATPCCCPPRDAISCWPWTSPAAWALRTWNSTGNSSTALPSSSRWWPTSSARGTATAWVSSCSAQNAYLQAPLTFDLETVNRLLVEAPVGIAGGKTAIGDAIGLAVKRLRQRPDGERVLILLTDGANNVGEVAPVKAAELAAGEEIRIYTIGVGADEMRMPSIFGAFGPRIVNPSADLDEETLNRVAATTGGRYFRARSTSNLAEVYAIIDALEPVEQDPETYRPVAALYYWPLGLAWILACVLLVFDARGTGRG